MKRMQIFLSLATALLIVVTACSSKGDGSDKVLAASDDSSTLASDNGAGPDGRNGGFRLGVPGLPDPDVIPQGGVYDAASGWFVVAAETDSGGATIQKSYSFRDAAEAPQAVYDEATTASLALHVLLDAHPSHQGQTGTVHHEVTLTATGMAGAETNRVWNGTVAEQSQGVPPGPPAGGPGGPRGPGNPPANPPDFSQLRITTNTVVTDVVLPHPFGAETWPLSGSIARTTHEEGGPNGAQDHASLLTFNGTRYASLTVDGQTTQVDLTKPPRPPRPPRPSGN
jgi:hypothetical protein